MKFSGHETFALRYAWLPKAYRYLASPACPGFGDEDAAMVDLGLGKNMVRALHFWVQAFGLAAVTDGRLELTPLAHQVFGVEGVDPFLEDPRTLWLLHWHLSVRPSDPIGAWDVLVNRWPKAEFTKSEAIGAFRRASERGSARPLSDVTLGQHFDVFIHTYVAGRGSGGPEETLDSPLAELGLIEQLGDRRTGPDGRTEAVYAFCRDEKTEVTPDLFAYFVDHSFTVFKTDEATRTFRELLSGPYAPGQVLRLPEGALRTRLEQLAAARGAAYQFHLSAVQSVLVRECATAQDLDADRLARQSALLKRAFGSELAGP